MKNTLQMQSTQRHSVAHSCLAQMIPRKTRGFSKHSSAKRQCVENDPKLGRNGSTKWIRLRKSKPNNYFITWLAFSPGYLFAAWGWNDVKRARWDMTFNNLSTLFATQALDLLDLFFLAVRRSKPAHVPKHAIQHGDCWSVAIWVWVQLHPLHSFEMPTATSSIFSLRLVLWKIPSSPHWAWDPKNVHLTLHSCAQWGNLHEILESFERTLVPRIELFHPSLLPLSVPNRRKTTVFMTWQISSLCLASALTSAKSLSSICITASCMFWAGTRSGASTSLIKTSTSFFLASICSCRDGIAVSKDTQMTRVTRGCCLWQKDSCKGTAAKASVFHGGSIWFHDFLPWS